MCVPQSLVVGRSDRGVVALTHVTAYSRGITLDIVAAGRGLREEQVQNLFHEQHAAGPAEELPAGFLRVGVEFADSARVANFSDRRRIARPGREPEGPVLFQRGGGGGSGGSGVVTMHPAYWLWPLPPPGTLRLFVEWPALGVALSSVDLDAGAIIDAAARAQPLWTD